MNLKLNKLITERKKLNLSTRQIAKILGISSSMYNYVEQGKKRLSYDLAERLAKFFSTTPDELFYEDFSSSFDNITI